MSIVGRTLFCATCDRSVDFAPIDARGKEVGQDGYIYDLYECDCGDIVRIASIVACRPSEATEEYR